MKSKSIEGIPKNIEEAGNKYAQQFKHQVSNEGLENIAKDFCAGAMDDTTKEFWRVYWFKEFKKEK